MSVDLTPLANATERLEEAMTRYRSDTSDSIVRDGLVQRFEFTFDTATKTLRRALESVADSPGEIDRMSFPTLIRTAAERGLVEGGWPAWKIYRDMRNITSHTYDEEQARKVVAAIPAFVSEAQGVLARLRQQL